MQASTWVGSETQMVKCFWCLFGCCMRLTSLVCSTVQTPPAKAIAAPKSKGHIYTYTYVWRYDYNNPLGCRNAHARGPAAGAPSARQLHRFCFLQRAMEAKQFETLKDRWITGSATTGVRPRLRAVTGFVATEAMFECSLTRLLRPPTVSLCRDFHAQIRSIAGQLIVIGIW